MLRIEAVLFRRIKGQAIFCLVLFLFQFLSAHAQRPSTIGAGGLPFRQDSVPKGKTLKPKEYTGKGSTIVDDSTKNIYGPKTALWITERDLFYNKKNYQPLDTLLTNYHRWTYTQRLNNFYQDLGNMGTALNPIFPVISSTIGASSGFKAYELYYLTEEIKYFDTKSPYSGFRIVWGGNGRASTRVEFSRNINPRWNFGFNYRPIWVDKQILRQKAVRQTVSQYYDFYTSYKSKNDRYLLLASYKRIRHRIKENGGILLSKIDSTFHGYFQQNAQPYLFGAETEESRNGLHLHHQFQLVKPFQIYQSIDLMRQRNIFRDDRSKEINSFFDQVVRNPGADSVKVTDVNDFKMAQTELGVKGNAAFLFYNFYFKVRYFNNYDRYLAGYDLGAKTKGIENYVGTRIAFRFDSLSELSGNAEYMLDGRYRLEAQLNTPWFEASAISALAKPGFMQMNYRGSYDFWIQNFSNTFSNQLKAAIKVNVGRLFISPGATYTALTNNVYFKKDPLAGKGLPSIHPYQSSGNQQLFSPELKMSVRFLRHFYLRPQAIYSFVLKNDDAVLQVPKVFTNVQLAYENVIARGNLKVQAGVDLHWKSSYYALGYAPSLQQFYVQDQFVTPSYLLTDVFFNGQLKRGRFFIKYHNLLQAFTKTGYLPTPYYRGVGNLMDFGFDLFLFD